MIIQQLFEARDQAERLRMDLTELLDKEQPFYQGRLTEEIELLKDALDKSQVPELFRIAVVGTFKTGKSSFVNKLAEERLAGVETNPETAAISIFRYQPEFERGAEVFPWRAFDWLRKFSGEERREFVPETACFRRGNADGSSIRD